MHEFEGEVKSFTAWANDPRCAVSRRGLRKRLDSGWSFERALLTPAKTVGSISGRKGNKVAAFGETKSVHAWTLDPRCKVPRTTLRERLAAGFDPEVALTMDMDAGFVLLPEWKPNGLRLLDLFCGAGGTSMGYYKAGFEVVGVDINPQPNYPFEFHQADAMEFPLWGFDVIAASPPCQRYSPITRCTGKQGDHPDLLQPVIDRLKDSGAAWIVENVPFSPMDPDVVLCGSMFDLPIRRHRWFVTSTSLKFVAPCDHKPTDLSFEHGAEQPESLYRDSMECYWMTTKESREAIPPAYCEWLGRLVAFDLNA